jgi:hypothetical protein
MDSSHVLGESLTARRARSRILGSFPWPLSAGRSTPGWRRIRTLLLRIFGVLGVASPRGAFKPTTNRKTFEKRLETRGTFRLCCVTDFPNRGARQQNRTESVTRASDVNRRNPRGSGPRGKIPPQGYQPKDRLNRHSTREPD